MLQTLLKLMNKTCSIYYEKSYIMRSHEKLYFSSIYYEKSSHIFQKLTIHILFK